MKTLPLLLVLLAIGGGILAALRPWEDSLDAPGEAAPAPDEVPVVRRLLPSPVEEHPTSASEARPLEDARTPWILRNNRAVQALEEGRLAEAIEDLRACRTALPDHEAFRTNLAEALVRYARQLHEERQLEPALALLDEALVEGHDRADIGVLRGWRDRWRTEAEVERDHWSEGSDLFELSYDTGRKDILHNSTDVLEHLEREYERLRLWFGEDPVREHGRERIRVVLYNRAEFDRLTGLGDWAGGVFDGNVRISVEDLTGGGTRWKGLLTHELVHVFVHQFGGPNVPGWLNEGLAQQFEGPASRVAQSRARLRRERVFPLERLQGSLAAWDNVQDIALAYAQSLVFVDEIRTLHGDEGLRRMVVACKDGAGFAEAFRAWAGLSLDDLFQDWKWRLPEADGN